jgi:mannose-6-phosphate isomerase-like protein (cupin superfamily)
VFLQDQIYEVEEGDMLFVPKGAKFWINGKKIKLVVVSSPPWFAEQHLHIEK